MTKYLIALIFLVIVIKVVDMNPTAQITTLIAVGTGLIVQAIHELTVVVRTMLAVVINNQPSKPAVANKSTNAKKPGK